jgi:D-alanyl-lipoteichoic acid acyltransferase DltB (MBOAT superfamily)
LCAWADLERSFFRDVAPRPNIVKARSSFTFFSFAFAAAHEFEHTADKLSFMSYPRKNIQSAFFLESHHRWSVFLPARIFYFCFQIRMILMELRQTPGTNVMIQIFCDFRQFSAKKIGVFLK